MHKYLLNQFFLLFFFSSNSLVALAQTDPIKQKIDKGDYKQITSVLVNHQGQRVFEEYYGDGSKDNLNDIRSASKTFTALALGIAIENQKISSVDDYILKYLPGHKKHKNPFQSKRTMTFEDLLTMTSQLECNDWNNFSLGNEERMYLQANWGQFIMDLPQRGIPPWEPKIQNRFNQKAYSYCTGGVFITGKAIENATATRADIYLQKHLFSKMDIENVTWPYSPGGHAQTGGGVKITSSDLIKIGQLMLDNGNWNGEQLISSDWIAQMKQPYVEIDEERNIKYGYLTWIYSFEVNNKNDVNNKKVTAWAAAGNGGNYLWIVPELNLTAVVTSTAFNQSYMHKQSQEIFTEYVLPMAE